MAKFGFNYRQFQNELKKDIRNSKDIAKDAFDAAEIEVEQIKEEILNSLNNNKVTKEIESGPDGENITGTVDALEGNLFSFIGFSDGDNPIEPLRELIMVGTNITFVSSPVYTGPRIIRYKFPVNAPSMADVEKVTPMPWGGGSWAIRIEQSISGIKRYLFSSSRSFKNSRSGSAIQTKKGILNDAARFNRVKYMSSILEELNSRLFAKL